MAGLAFGKDNGVGGIEGGCGVACEPVIGEDLEVVAIGEDGVWGFFVWVGVIAGAGFDAGDLFFECCCGRGWGVFAVEVGVVFGYAGADAVDAVAVGVEVVEAELIRSDGIDGDAGADACCQAGDIDQCEAFVVVEAAECKAEGVDKHRISVCR